MGKCQTGAAPKPGCISTIIRHISLLVLAALIAAALVGCAGGPDYHRPETTTPSAWDGQNALTPVTPSKTTINPVTLVEWWTAFNDPTLSYLVDMAVRANLDVRLAEARIRQARAARWVAGAPLWPQADATVLYERSHSPSAAVDTAGGGFAVAAPGSTYGRQPAVPGIISGRSGCLLGIGYFRGHATEP